jgi:hypothetical protein
MPGDSIPDDLRDFILGHMESIAHLEALLLLRRESDVTWHEDSVSQRLYISPQAASDVLRRLAADGFLNSDEGMYRYQCRTEELRSMVDRLADIYAHQLIPVTNLIHARPLRIQQFADAFKLRKDP